MDPSQFATTGANATAGADSFDYLNSDDGAQWNLSRGDAAFFAAALEMLAVVLETLAALF